MTVRTTFRMSNGDVHIEPRREANYINLLAFMKEFRLESVPLLIKITPEHHVVIQGKYVSSIEFEDITENDK